MVIALFSGGLALAADEVTKLTARDLAVETNKWKGKKVETVMPCAYADALSLRQRQRFTYPFQNNFERRGQTASAEILQYSPQDYNEPMHCPDCVCLRRLPAG